MDALRRTLVVFRTGPQRFGIPVAAAERVLPVVEISPLPGAPPVVAGIINVGGSVLPVLDLGRRFGQGAADPRLDARLLLLRTLRRRLAILCDEVEGACDIPGETLAAASALAPGTLLLRGVAAAGDALIYVYDAEALLTPPEETGLDAALRGRDA